MPESLSHHIKSRYWIALLLYCLTPYVIALPEDAQSIIHMHAGAVDLNQQTHQGIYTGGIALDQGTTHILAEQAKTEGNAEHRFTKAIIEGNQKAQAHYWTLVSKDKPVMHAFADKIIYYPLKHEISLIGHAHVQQGPHSFNAPVIHYNLNTQHVLSKPAIGEQTTIIFQPDQTS